MIVRLFFSVGRFLFIGMGAVIALIGSLFAFSYLLAKRSFELLFGDSGNDYQI